MIYLDSATTQKPMPETISFLSEALSRNWGNPSGAHKVARDSKNVLELAREDFALGVGVNPDQVVFTSGATEALNLVIQGFARKNPKAILFYSAIEHAAVKKPIEYFQKFGHKVFQIGVDHNALVNLDFTEKVNDGDLVCVMPVNNENGVVNNVNEITKKVHEKGGLVLLDCVQSIYAYQPKELVKDCDFAVFSGHKLGAPQGVGVLVIKNRKTIDPMSFGGSQEWELRPGTTPVYLVETFVKVFLEFLENREEHIALLEKYRTICENELTKELKDIEIYSASVERSPHIVSFNAKSESQMLVAMADRNGVCISRGSACASGAVTPSHVLIAMGVDEKQALNTLRISFSPGNSEEEVMQGTHIILDCIKKLRDLDGVLA